MTNPARAGKHILLVEDSAEARAVLVPILDAAGHAVCTAANGHEALDYLRSHPPPDLILLDLVMPVMNGWELRAAQRVDPRLARVPVVVLSGVAALAAEVDTLGDVGYLQDPVAPETLLQTVDRFARPRKPGVLVVEDEPAVLTMLERLLRHHGFAPVLAGNSHAALAAFRQHYGAIDLVLLDVQMPAPDGPATLAALRQIDPYVRAVFMSGNTGGYTADALLALGALRVLGKPFANLAEDLWALVAP